jgi:hypothetical protein
MDPAEPIPFRSDTALLDELTGDDWAALCTAAGVGGRTSLLSVELRQLGGAFGDAPPDAGAFGALTGPLLYWGCGFPGEETAADLSRVRAALRPRMTGRTAPTFVDHVHQEQRTYDEATRRKVEAIRAETDPDGLFAGDVTVIRDAA